MRVVITGGPDFIGTTVVERCLSLDVAVLNLDTATPRNPIHRPHWRHVSILDGPSLKRQIIDWQPTHIILLAARSRSRVIKIGTKVVRHGRYITFQMAEVAISRPLFAEILRLIDGLRPAPLPP